MNAAWPLASLLCFALLTVTPVCAALPRGAGTTCSLEHSTVDFGARDHSRGTTTLFELVVTCPSGVPYEIALLQSPHCDLTRTLTHNDAQLAYTIYLPDRRSVWCDGTNGTDVFRSVGTGVPQYLSGFAVVRAERVTPLPSAIFLDDIVVVLTTQ